MDIDGALRKKFSVSKKDGQRLVSSIRGYFHAAGRKNAVIGISGGVDSALVCHLLCKALGPKNVYAYHLPYIQNEADGRDAESLAKMLGANFRLFDIRRAVDALTDTFKPGTRIASGNIRVRTRMMALYTFAHALDALVVGTGNRTELLLGYFTKYGDGGCDLLPIGNYYKTQVWELAKLCGLPDHINNKVPSAGMWDGQTDEKEIGVTYSDIDKILCAHFDLKMDWEKLEKYFKAEKVQRIRELNQLSEHKRKMPPII